MKQTLPIILLLAWMAISAEISAEPSPNVLILHGNDIDEPVAEALKQQLEQQMSEIKLNTTVILKQVPSPPEHDDEWIDTAKNISRPSGTVATIGIRCTRKHCDVTVIPPKESNYARIRVEKNEEPAEERVASLTATIREMLLGALLPELKRLKNESEHPSPSSKAADGILLESPFESKRKEAPPARRPWLWLSAGYHGDHPHPEGHPIHGPFVGLDVSPTNLIGVGFSVGWLGIRQANEAGTDVTVHRVDLSLALRLLFPLGPAKISISAIGRLDTAFVNIDDTSDNRNSGKDTRLEFQTGGLTMWHLPLPRKLDAWVGAGVLVSLVSHGVEVSRGADRKEMIVDASTVRMIWCAGVAFSPFTR